MKVFQFQDLNYRLQIEFVCFCFVRILLQVFVGYVRLKVYYLTSIYLLITLKSDGFFETLGILNQHLAQVEVAVNQAVLVGMGKTQRDLGNI